MSERKEVYLGLQDALYKTKCEACGHELEWTIDPDADGPSWSADCCDLFYHLGVTTVRLTVEDES